MEYLELGDLRIYLDGKQPLPEHEVREITYQILDGLFLMHDNGFAHRDLKPNVSLFFVLVTSSRESFSNLAFRILEHPFEIMSTK
jgi:Protein kinase domain